MPIIDDVDDGDGILVPSLRVCTMLHLCVCVCSYGFAVNQITIANAHVQKLYSA